MDTKNNNDMKRAAVTGHRPDRLGNEYDMKGPVSSQIERDLMEFFLEFKPDLVIVGGAIGIDMISALLAIKLNIPLLVAVPFEGQEKKWSKDLQELYYKILSSPNVTKVVVSTGGYHPSKMHIRNRWMVDKLEGEDDVLISVCDGSESGTKSCTDYAKEKRKKVFEINPTDYVRAAQIKSSLIQPVKSLKLRI